jgi:hypothetical protein
MSDYIQIATILGNHNTNKKEMLTNNFYTLCLKNPKENIGLRKKSNFKYNEIIFKSSDITLHYLCSDFVRFCLALYKNNQQMGTDNMTLIPKQTIPISKELKEYIEEFLPDYYGIRK